MVLRRESLQVRGVNEGHPFRNQLISFARNVYIVKRSFVFLFVSFLFISFFDLGFWFLASYIFHFACLHRNGESIAFLFHFFSLTGYSLICILLAVVVCTFCIE